MPTAKKDELKNKPLSLLPYSESFLKSRVSYNFRQSVLSFTFSSTSLAIGGYSIYHALASNPVTFLAPEIIIPITFGALFIGISYILFHPTFNFWEKYKTFKELSQTLSSPLEDKDFIQETFPSSAKELQKAFINQYEVDQFLNKKIHELTPQASDEIRIKIKDQVIKNITKSGLINPIKLLTKEIFPSQTDLTREIKGDTNSHFVMNWTTKLVTKYKDSPAFSYQKLAEEIKGEVDRQAPRRG